LKSLSGYDHILDKETIIQQTRQEMAQNLTSNLLSMTGGSGSAMNLLGNSSAPAKGYGNTSSSNKSYGNNGGNGGDYESVWVESPECTACDDCIAINSDIFSYNDQKQVIVVDPHAGTYKDIVKAAEKCSAECIHPGTPFNPNEAGLDKLIKRAEKYQ